MLNKILFLKNNNQPNDVSRKEGSWCDELADNHHAALQLASTSFSLLFHTQLHCFDLLSQLSAAILVMKFWNPLNWSYEFSCWTSWGIQQQKSQIVFSGVDGEQNRSTDLLQLFILRMNGFNKFLAWALVKFWKLTLCTHSTPQKL